MSSPLRHIMADPAYAYYYAQKALRIMPLRRMLGRWVTAWVRRRPTTAPVAASPELASRLAYDLQETGFAAAPEKALPASALDDIRAQFKDCSLSDFYGSGREYRLDNVPPDALKLSYRHADVFACKPLADLINDPDILAAVTRVLGATPTLATAAAWWTFGENNAKGKAEYDDIYHRDVDDLRFVKIFAYLTDTEIDTGAHRFILGSHADEHFVRRGPISDADVDSVYPSSSMKTITGKAGTVFLEDTWGIHRAMLATRGRRLVFSAIYVVASHVPFGPAKPLRPLPDGYNAYVNRLLYY
jgi:hypothetical protein